jgi:hypothetical protein
VLEVRSPHVEAVKAMEAFAWYLEQEGTYLGADEANAKLDERLRKRAARRDMDTLLRPDLPTFDVDAAAAAGTRRGTRFTELPAME